MRDIPDNAPFLPEPISYKDVKEGINSARTLNNTVNRLLRITRPGALNLDHVGDGGATTRYEVREFQIAKSVNERRKSIRRKKLGIVYGQTLGRMGTLQQNNLIPDKRTARDFSAEGLKRFISRQNELMARSTFGTLELYYKNYIKGLDTVFGGYNEYDKIVANIASIIRNRIKDDPQSLLNFFESGDELLTIEFIYAPESRGDKLRYIFDRWAEI